MVLDHDINTSILAPMSVTYKAEQGYSRLTSISYFKRIRRSKISSESGHKKLQV